VKRAAQREKVASSILFDESLGLCDAADTRTFMEKQFGLKVTPSAPRPSRRTPAAAAAAPTQRTQIQTTLTSAMFGDTRLSREMRAIKRSKARALATEKV